MYYDRKALKFRARASLRGVQPRPWKVTLLYWLLAALIPGAVTLVLQLVGSSGMFAYWQAMVADPVGWSARLETMDFNELMSYYSSMFVPAVGAGLISTFVTILVRLFQLVMSYGYANYALKLYRGEPTGTGNIFSGFPVAGRAIGAGVLTYLFEFLWTLLAVVLGTCATLILVVAMVAFGSSAAELVVGILLILVWAAVILFSIFISYRYSLVPYFVLTTEMGAMDAVRASKEGMRGNLGRRFMLELSFLGWELLNALIAIVVVLVGYFVLVFALSFAVVLQAGDVDPYYFENEAYLNQVVGQVLSQALVGMGILAVVAQVATLPIGLWLTAYKGSAYAGFFLSVTGQDAPQPQVVQPPVNYAPPRPSDIWEQVPPPPSFTAPAVPAEPAGETLPEEKSPAEPESPAEEPETKTPSEELKTPAGEPEAPAEKPETEE